MSSAEDGKTIRVEDKFNEILYIILNGEITKTIDLKEIKEAK